jgi:hypothetical protein
MAWRRGMVGQMKDGRSNGYVFLGLSVMTCFLSGCGMSQITSGIGDGGIFSSKKTEAAWTPIITEDSMMTAARTNSDGPIEMAAASNCPGLKVEGGQRSVTIYDKNRIGDGAAVVDRGEITKTARECKLIDGVMQVKYGIAGRLVLGPKGKPGTVTLPVTMDVVDKSNAKMKTEPFTISVTITKQNPLSFFAVVRDVAIPIKEGTTPQDYNIVVAFDKKQHGSV